MKTHVITDVATFQPGTILGLSEAQAAPRVHALKKLGAGRYETTATVQFKVGETIGVDGDLPKHLASAVIDEKEAARRAKADKAKETKAAADLRKQIQGEVYAELLALLPEALRAQVEKVVADAAAKAAGK